MLTFPSLHTIHLLQHPIVARTIRMHEPPETRQRATHTPGTQHPRKLRKRIRIGTRSERMGNRLTFEIDITAAVIGRGSTTNDFGKLRAVSIRNFFVAQPSSQTGIGALK